mgnify:CR=1 FL=1
MPPRWARRLLLPVILLVEAWLLAAFGAGAGVAALLWPFSKRHRELRVAAFGVDYLSTDLAAVGACGWLWLRRSTSAQPAGWWEEEHYRLLGWALKRVLTAAHELFQFQVAWREPEDNGALVDDGPVLVLSRHGGPGDSFVVAHALIDRYARRPRIVLKEMLALDPALDLILSRLGSCFLPSSAIPGHGLPDQLAKVASELRGRDALLVFPEGGNWTPSRRRRAIDKLRARGKRRAAARAEQMPHVMPPRPAGFLACVDATPDARIVVIAHTGLEEIITARAGWSALPLRRPMEVSWWEADRATLPVGEEPRSGWLHEQWGQVERWITDHGSDEPLTW